MYRAVKTHINHVKAVLASTRISHVEVQGVRDVRGKATKIVDVCLKTRQIQVVERW